MLSLSDTTVRVYRKKDGQYSFRVSGYLLVSTNATFNLDAYLRDIYCTLTFQAQSPVRLECSYSVDCVAEYSHETMLHNFKAWGSSNEISLTRGVTLATLRTDYHISFTGHPAEEPQYTVCVVPVVLKTETYKGM